MGGSRPPRKMNLARRHCSRVTGQPASTGGMDHIRCNLRGHHKACTGVGRPDHILRSQQRPQSQLHAVGQPAGQVLQCLQTVSRGGQRQGAHAVFHHGVRDCRNVRRIRVKPPGYGAGLQHGHDSGALQPAAHRRTVWHGADGFRCHVRGQIMGGAFRTVSAGSGIFLAGFHGDADDVAAYRHGAGAECRERAGIVHGPVEVHNDS